MNKLKGLSDKKRVEIAAVAETIENTGQLVRKVDRKSKTGDFVRFNGLVESGTMNDTFYEVKNVDQYVDEFGDLKDIYSWRTSNSIIEIFEVVGNNMVSLNEIASLVQRLRTIVDQSKRDVLGVHLGSFSDYVQLDNIAFLTEFIEFNITVVADDEFPYELISSIGGIVFCAVMSAKDIVDLKTTIPDQFDYITSKVQVDGI